jgi:hypothetical protein
MVDFAALTTKRERYKQWAQTPIGAAFQRFEIATQNYWQQDGNERGSYRRLQELYEERQKARAAFIGLLMGAP